MKKVVLLIFIVFLLYICFNIVFSADDDSFSINVSKCSGFKGEMRIVIRGDNTLLDFNSLEVEVLEKDKAVVKGDYGPSLLSIIRSSKSEFKRIPKEAFNCKETGSSFVCIGKYYGKAAHAYAFRARIKTYEGEYYRGWRYYEKPYCFFDPQILRTRCWASYFVSCPCHTWNEVDREPPAITEFKVFFKEEVLMCEKAFLWQGGVCWPRDDVYLRINAYIKAYDSISGISPKSYKIYECTRAHEPSMYPYVKYGAPSHRDEQCPGKLWKPFCWYDMQGHLLGCHGDCREQPCIERKIGSGWDAKTETVLHGFSPDDAIKCSPGIVRYGYDRDYDDRFPRKGSPEEFHEGFRKAFGTRRYKIRMYDAAGNKAEIVFELTLPPYEELENPPSEWNLLTPKIISSTQTCSDGTSYGQCSSEKPKYCDNGNLVDRCDICGCPEGYSCQDDGSCTAPSLSATLTAEPSSGVDFLNNVDLIASISGTGTIQGNTNYTFWCDCNSECNNLSDCKKDCGDWNHRKENHSEDTYTASDICNYPQPGIYYPKLIVEKGSITAEAGTVIDIFSSPPTTECLGDVNGDLKVDIYDLAILISHWGQENTADLNDDNIVDIQDLNILLQNWGNECKEEKCTVEGDADNNNEVNCDDLDCVLGVVLGEKTLKECPCSDVNKDGKINQLDVSKEIDILLSKGIECGKCKQCSDCGDGLFNICDREECMSCQANCYFISKMVGGDCLSCSSASSCQDYQNDETTCQTDPCGFGNCKWENNKCISE